MRENKKDWGSPAFVAVYIGLAGMDARHEDNSISDWLNRNGFANLTCCPECHVDDFTHVEGCIIGASIETAVEAEKSRN